MDETIGLRVVPSASRADVVAALFESYSARLVGLARQLVDDRSEAEEILQEAFTRLYVALGRVRSPEKATAYLHTVTMNSARSRLRRRRVARHAVVPAGAASSEKPGAPGEGELDGAIVRAAVAALPRREMECVLLRYYAGMSEAEIAAALGVAVGTVKTSLHRARADLAGRLEALR
jgi:RNA polymerase sigma-70 factor (sigma-E family)